MKFKYNFFIFIFLINAFLLASYLSYKNDLNRSVFGLRHDVTDSIISSNFIDLERKVNHYSEILGAQIYFSKEIDYKASCVFSTHYPIQIDGLNIGYISDCPDYTFFLTYLVKRSILIYLFSIILLIFLIQLIFYKRSVGRFINLIKNKNNIESINVSALDPVATELYNIILRLIKSEESYKQLRAESVINLKISELAQQVAHDIRSPLSSLNMISSTLDNISEEQKNILAQSIGRINSIANDLLEKGNGNLSDPSFMDPKVNKDRNTFYLTPTIKNIISEKRAQYNGRQNIFINFNNPSNIDELTDFPKTEIERIVSNIINNSIESLMSEKGEVEVLLDKIEKFLTITIKDNGKGIPKEILSKIGQKGFSYGKEHLDQSGSGLGLYHAKKTMQEFGGELLIDSEVGVGTTVTLKIPLVDQSIAY